MQHDDPSKSDAEHFFHLNLHYYNGDDDEAEKEYFSPIHQNLIYLFNDFHICYYYNSNWYDINKYKNCYIITNDI